MKIHIMIFIFVTALIILSGIAVNKTNNNNNRIQALEADVEAMQTEIGIHLTEIGALQTEIGALRTETGALQTEVAVVNTEVDALKTEVANIGQPYTTQLCAVYRGMIESGRSAYTEMPDFCAALPEKFVFITSGVYAGDLGGIAGADSKCQELAESEDAGLPGRYKAWLASSSADSPVTRFTRSLSPYVLVNGTIVADNWHDLTDSSLDHPIDLDETGAYVGGFAWTNVFSFGEVAYHPSSDEMGQPPVGGSRTCGMWSSESPDGSGSYGSSDSQNSQWTYSDISDCASQNHLYCVQQ